MTASLKAPLSTLKATLILGFEILGSRDPACAHQRFSSLEPIHRRTERSSPSQRPSLPSVARRGHRTDGAWQPRTDCARDRLAKTSLPPSGRCAICRRLRAGGDLRSSGGARTRNSLSRGIEHAAQELRKSNSLIGTALRLFTDDAANQDALKTSLGTLTRVLDAVIGRTSARISRKPGSTSTKTSLESTTTSFVGGPALTTPLPKLSLLWFAC